MFGLLCIHHSNSAHVGLLHFTCKILTSKKMTKSSVIFLYKYLQRINYHSSHDFFFYKNQLTKLKLNLHDIKPTL